MLYPHFPLESLGFSIFFRCLRSSITFWHLLIKHFFTLLLGPGSLIYPPWPVSHVYLCPPEHRLKDWAHFLSHIQANSFHLLPGTSPFFKNHLSLLLVSGPQSLCTFLGFAFQYLHIMFSSLPHLPVIQRTVGSSTPASWELQPTWS